MQGNQILKINGSEFPKTEEMLKSSYLRPMIFKQRKGKKILRQMHQYGSVQHQEGWGNQGLDTDSYISNDLRKKRGIPYKD